MSKIINDDNFENTKMTFGEHIEELRKVLVKSLLGLVIFCGVGLYFGSSVVKFIQEPLVRALNNYYTDKAKTKLAETMPLTAEEKATIDAYNLAPEEMQVDAWSIVDAMKYADPEGIEIKVKKHRCTVAQLTDEHTKALAKHFVTEARSGKNEQMAFLWGLLRGPDQLAMERIQEEETFITLEDKRQVIAVLNKLIDNPAVQRSEHFQAIVDDSESLQELQTEIFGKENNAESDKLLSDTDQDKLRLLNRGLLMVVFEDYLDPPGAPLVALRMWKEISVNIQALSAHEVFLIWLKAGIVFGLVIGSPWVFYHVWDFVSAGLYPHEKRYVYMYLPFSLALFLAGAALAFFFVFDPVLDFLFQFNKAMNIDPDPRIGEWISFVLTLPLGFGVAFQLPLVMLLLNRIGIISIEVYLDKWRIAVLAIFVLSMLLTPADPISMLLMALPLTGLYFLGIALCKYMPQGQNPFQEAYEP